jgi:hypothetical protein
MTDRLRAGRVLVEMSGTGLEALESLSPIGSRSLARTDESPSKPQHQQHQRERKERERALAHQRSWGGRLGDALVKLGFIRYSGYLLRKKVR